MTLCIGCNLIKTRSKSRTLCSSVVISDLTSIATICGRSSLTKRNSLRDNYILRTAPTIGLVGIKFSINFTSLTSICIAISLCRSVIILIELAIRSIIITFKNIINKTGKICRSNYTANGRSIDRCDIASAVLMGRSSLTTKLAVNLALLIIQVVVSMGRRSKSSRLARDVCPSYCVCGSSSASTRGVLN